MKSLPRNAVRLLLSYRGSCRGLGVGLLALACGGGPKEADDPSGHAESAASELEWKDKNRQQRTDWMGLHVLPKMKPTFVAFDAERFADFGCQTCHGADMDMVDFDMPTNQLYALARKDTLEKARSYDANITEFMLREVMPEMARLLDTAPYDPAARSGFGCFGCHPAEAD